MQNRPRVLRRSREVPTLAPSQCWHGALIGTQYQAYAQLRSSGVDSKTALDAVGLKMDRDDPVSQCECCRAMLLANSDLTYVRALYLNLATWAEGRAEPHTKVASSPDKHKTEHGKT